MILDFKRRKRAMNNKLPKTKIDERTGIEYHLDGDYYIPNLAIPKQEKITLNKNDVKINARRANSWHLL